MTGKKEILPIILVAMLFISFLSSAFVMGPFVLFGNSADITDEENSATTLNVTVLQLQPRVNWYDFQYNNSGTWESKLNQQIDVDNSNEYRFIVNISSDQGWDDIEYVWINAWHDLGDDNGSYYNETAGGNINLNLTYENDSGTAFWNMSFPTAGEVTLVPGDCTETNETDPEGSPGNTYCRNLTFAFIPSYQFRNAAGDGSWDDGPGFNDTWSWNFNITVVDLEGPYYSWDNPIIGNTTDEFGVFSYTDLISVGWPVISGNPDTFADNDSFITMETRSNGNYSLSVNVTNLTHKANPSYTIANTTIWTEGGDLSQAQFDGSSEQWYYGGAASYHAAENDGTIVTTNDIGWAVSIPLGAHAGDYNATIYYHLYTQT